MRSARPVLLAALWLLGAPAWGQANTQQSVPAQPTRDPQAVAALQQSVTSMGGKAPSDSTATGTVTTVLGTETEQGTIRMLSRGTQQTLVEVQTPKITQIDIFSNGEASETVGGTATPFPSQRAVTSQLTYFPLPYLTALLGNPDEAFTYVGIENVDGVAALHIQAINTYSSNAIMQFLAAFTTTDIWLDAQTYLPLRVAYLRRDTGLAPKICMEVNFSDYKNVAGFSYPATVQVW